MLFQKISIALTVKFSWLDTLSIPLEIPVLNLHAFLKRNLAFETPKVGLVIF